MGPVLKNRNGHEELSEEKENQFKECYNSISIRKSSGFNTRMAFGPPQNLTQKKNKIEHLNATNGKLTERDADGKLEETPARRSEILFSLFKFLLSLCTLLV